MTDHANELRRHARKILHPQGETPGVMLRAADEIECLRIENEALRAKVARMERQEPVEWQSRSRPTWNNGPWTQWSKCSEGYAKDIMKSPLVQDWIYEVRPLYALPGAQTQGEEK